MEHTLYFHDFYNLVDGPLGLVTTIFHFVLSPTLSESYAKRSTNSFISLCTFSSSLQDWACLGREDEEACLTGGWGMGKGWKGCRQSTRNTATY